MFNISKHNISPEDKNKQHKNNMFVFAPEEKHFYLFF